MSKRIGIITAAVIGLAVFGHFQSAVAADPASPPGCNADHSGVDIGRSTASAHVGQTVTFTVSASNVASADGCDITNRTMTLTLPDGSTHVFGPFNYPNPTPLATVGSSNYVAASADLVAGKWNATVSWTGTQKDGFDDPSTGSKGTAVNLIADTLEVSKDAIPTATQDYTWSIDKSVTPATWNLFKGDTGTSEYTIGLVKTLGAATQAVSGTITIHNPAPFATAHVTTVSDVITGLGAVTVNCPGGLPHDIAAGTTYQCTYSSSLPDKSTRTNTATVTTTGDVAGNSGQASIDFANVVPTVTHGTVNIDDSYNAGDGGPFSDSTSYKYSRPFTCGSAQGQYSGLNNHVVNTATIVETSQSDNAEVVVNCYGLTVDKTANTTFDRKYNWTVDKSADQTEITLATGESFDIHYTVVASVTGHTDSNWMVTGNITIANPNPARAADLTNVVDMLTGALSATVNCPDTHVAAASSMVCTYSRTLPDGTSRTNTATATQQNYNYDKDGVATLAGTTDSQGTAPVTFGAPTNLIDEQVDVTDTYAGPLGTATVAESPKSFHYTRTVSYGLNECGDHNVDNTATITTNDTQTTATDSWRVVVHVNCQVGCTLTQGYWKTHNASFKGGAPLDDNWNSITPFKELSGFFTTANSYPVIGPNTISTPFTWFSVFWTAPKGNPYYNLAHQYMAAKLNILNGASAPAAVTNAITSAETFFATYGPSTSWTKAQKTMLTNWAGTLGDYNEGLTGPGHCSEQVPTLS